MEFTPKICRICGAEYLPHNSNQKYCSLACRKEADLARQRQYNANVKMRMMTIDEKIDRKIEVGLARRTRRESSLNEIARRAKEAHMTYGKYVQKHNI